MVLNSAFESLMSKMSFKFKQFSIVQEKSAMKIGTDGVLLGAWTEADHPKTILDIGSGTGLIGLMLAQRFPNSEITAIEIEPNAFEESQLNFKNSPFAERCQVHLTSLQDFKTEEKFDLIVSNPPFFEFTHKVNSSRNLARQQSDLSFEELLFHTEKLMKPTTNAAFIIPHLQETQFLEVTKDLDLFPNKITRVRGNKAADFKRSLIRLSKEYEQPIIDELIIELNRNVYTEEYIAMTRYFYLKM